MSDEQAALREFEAAPLDLPAGLEIEWLGVSGYRMTYEGQTIFIDPYVSRVSLKSFLLRRSAGPDPAAIDRYIDPHGKVVAVIVGHTHFDHALDARAIQGYVHPQRPLKVDSGAQDPVRRRAHV